MELEKQVNQSKNGIIITFEALQKYSKSIFQEIDLLIIACRSKNKLIRYKTDQDMYESCDIVIEMIDGGGWEIFSKNIEWINQLASKFQEVEFLTSDFQSL